MSDSSEHSDISDFVEVNGTAHAALLRKIKEKISSMRFGRRKDLCPGYKLTRPGQGARVVSWVMSNNDHIVHPIPTRDYDDCTKLPLTTICNHNPCRTDTEYEYFMCVLVARGLLTHENWKNLRPIPRNVALNGEPTAALQSRGEFFQVIFKV